MSNKTLTIEASLVVTAIAAIAGGFAVKYGMEGKIDSAAMFTGVAIFAALGLLALLVMEIIFTLKPQEEEEQEQTGEAH